MNPIHTNGPIGSHIVDDIENQIVIIHEVEALNFQEVNIKKVRLTKRKFVNIFNFIFMFFLSAAFVIIGTWMLIDSKRYGYHVESDTNNNTEYCNGHGCLQRAFAMTMIVIGSLILFIYLCAICTICYLRIYNFYDKLED